MGPVHQVEFRGAHGSNLTNPARRKCGALKPAARLSTLATKQFVVSPREARPNYAGGNPAFTAFWANAQNSHSPVFGGGAANVY
jgi:hypothetical protein